MRRERLSGHVACERYTAEGMVLSGNKDTIKTYLEGDARLKNRFSWVCFFFFWPFSIRRAARSCHVPLHVGIA